jgi:putative PIN family toxin of toxin-antitoxin system
VKLVVDTNVLVSGSLWSGPASRLVDALADGKAWLCTSDILLAELEDVLQREKFRLRLEQAGQTALSISAGFRGLALLSDEAAISPPQSLRDPDDVHVLECAVSAAADAIVTGDRDLLALGKYEGIPIIDVREALRVLELDE